MLTVVACVVRSIARLAPQEDVHAVINEFIDLSVLFSLPMAASTGSSLLFLRVLERVRHSPAVDPLLVYHWFGKAMAAAIEGGHFAIVQLIHQAHPGSLAVRTFEVAATYGQLEILQWLFDHRFDMLCIDVPPAQKERRLMRCCMIKQCEDAARMHRRIRVLRWLHELGYKVSFSGAGNVAVMQRDLDMVQWLHHNNFSGAFTHAAIDAAVKSGDLEILRLLHESGIESDSEDLAMQAMVRGFPEIVAYLREQQIRSIVRPETLFVMAAEHGRLDLLQRMTSVTSDAWVREDALAVSVVNGHLHVAQWLGPHDINSSQLSRAAKGGHLDVLQWVHGQGCGEWDASIVHNAALAGHLHVIQWLQDNRPHLVAESRCFEIAAAEGHLAMVKWLQDHSQTRFVYNVCHTAGNGHMHVIQWLHKFREGGSQLTRWESQALSSAADHGHLELAMWLHGNGYTGPTGTLMHRSSVDVATWAHEVLQLPIDQVIIQNVAAQGDFVKLKWLYTRSEMRARGSEHPNLNQWIRANE